ncbi:MAG: DUF502 domain-containing protein [Steroidobacteraceae bacterium]|nr:DUF502 domain-containing protein [Steroidobacteraceae bacterium]
MEAQVAPPPDEKGSRQRHPARALRNYLIGGLLIWIPIMVTVWVVRFLSRILDNSLVLLPPAWRPEAIVGHYVPGVGIILSLLLLLLTGVVVRNLFGNRIVAGVEDLVRRIPVIGAVYGGAKAFSETVLTDKGKSFKQVVMVEFPRKGVFSIGFITADELEEVQEKTAQVVTCVFVPTTPNPTTGFIILVPQEEVVLLDMTVDEAFKMLLTLGVVVPKWNRKPVGGRLAPPGTGP